MTPTTLLGLLVYTVAVYFLAFISGYGCGLGAKHEESES